MIWNIPNGRGERVNSFDGGGGGGVEWPKLKKNSKACNAKE